MPPPVPERLAAIAAGERYYLTGKACRNGHVARRYTRSGLCVICAVANATRSAAKRPGHPARAAARIAGLTRYSTGEPCDHGHIAERMVSSGQCVICKVVVKKRFLARNPSAEARWARERRAEDPTGHRAEVKRWQARNPEVNRTNQARFRANKGRAYFNAAHKQWREANIETVRAYNAEKMRIRRGLRGNPNGGSYTPADIETIRISQAGTCAACGAKRKLEVDHIVAITKGGTNHPSNLQLLCRSCNASKHNYNFSNWLRTRLDTRLGVE